MTFDTESPLWTVRFSPDGNRLVVSGRVGMLDVLEASTGKRLSLTPGHTLQVTVWKLPDGSDGNPEELFTFKAGKFFVWKMNFSPDGTQLAVPFSEGMGIWDANTGEPIGTLPHPGSTFEAVFSQDGKRLATAGFDGFGRLFFLDMHELISMAKARLTRMLTDVECQKYLHLEECPVW